MAKATFRSLDIHRHAYAMGVLLGAAAMPFRQRYSLARHPIPYQRTMAHQNGTVPALLGIGPIYSVRTTRFTVMHNVSRLPAQLKA